MNPILLEAEARRELAQKTLADIQRETADHESRKSEENVHRKRADTVRGDGIRRVT